MDINKRGTPGGEIKIPESCGVAPAVSYMIFVTCFVPYFNFVGDVWMERLVTSAVLAVSFCTFLVSFDTQYRF